MQVEVIKFKQVFMKQNRYVAVKKEMQEKEFAL
jgi:hypothetical protein